jgi:hypothetical protein
LAFLGAGKTNVMDAEIPPAWVRNGAVRLEASEFGAVFGDCWRAADRGMDKVEVWQAYSEPDARSYSAFLLGDYGQVLGLIEAETRAEGFVYDDIRTKGKTLTRQRVVRLPLTPYLEWEFWSYLVRSALGDDVWVVDVTGIPAALPDPGLFDFLLFGRDAALVHDYAPGGVLDGGWLVTARTALERLADLVAGLKSRSVPLEVFIAGKGLRLRGEGLVF